MLPDTPLANLAMCIYGASSALLLLTAIGASWWFYEVRPRKMADTH